MLQGPFQDFAQKTALVFPRATYSYQDLDGASRLVAAALTGERVAILGMQTFETFAAVAAAIRSGRTYIPLDSARPDNALRRQLAMAHPDVLIVDPALLSRAEGFLQFADDPIPVLCPSRSEIQQDRHLVHVDLQRRGAPPRDETDQRSSRAMYEMFTSGTTGQPKRISIQWDNVNSYLESIKTLFDFGPDDRFSQFFKLSFDLSVHDMLVAWTSGGSLYVPSSSQLLNPVQFAAKHQLSVWFSVPSLARLAMMTRRLSPRSLPQLRHALFCGEALPWQVAKAFSNAAPNARLTNLYGPTEATIAITYHQLEPPIPTESSASEGTVPIGKPFPSQRAAVVDANNKLLPDGEVGELLLGGSQLAKAYNGDATQTAARFVTMGLPGFDVRRWYRTGDLVRSHAGVMTFVGRSDTQIKFRGHRIELSEIEGTLAQVARSPLAIVVPEFDPDHEATIKRLIAYVAGSEESPKILLEELQKQLPTYMLPAEVIELPTNGPWWNANGKVDRAKIRQWHISDQSDAFDE